MTVALAAKFARCFRYAATTRAVRPSTRYQLITDSEKLTSAPLQPQALLGARSGSNKN
jgi:hypothetical protein